MQSLARFRTGAMRFASYCAGGGAVALGFGVVALHNAHGVNVGEWLSIVGVVGVAAGAILYLTRTWHERGRQRATIRWAVAGLVAGGIGGALTFAMGIAGPYGVLVGAAVGIIALLCYGLYWHQDVLLASDESRSAISVALTWLIIISVALVLGILAWLV